MHEGIDGNFYYSEEEALNLIGVKVMCDEKDSILFTLCYMTWRLAE
jgi:hypothetical protein